MRVQVNAWGERYTEATWDHGYFGPNYLDGEEPTELTEAETAGAGSQDEALVGSPSDDVFVFNGQFGHQGVLDFEAGEGIGDILPFEKSRFADFHELIAAAEQVGSDVKIISDAENSVVLKQLELAALHVDDFRFV